MFAEDACSLQTRTSRVFLTPSRAALSHCPTNVDSRDSRTWDPSQAACRAKQPAPGAHHGDQPVELGSAAPHRAAPTCASSGPRRPGPRHYLHKCRVLQAVWKSTSASGAPDNSSLSHFSATTRPSWLGRAARNRHRHAIEQASRRWRGGRRDDSARTRRKHLISTQVTSIVT